MPAFKVEKVNFAPICYKYWLKDEYNTDYSKPITNAYRDGFIDGWNKKPYIGDKDETISCLYDGAETPKRNDEGVAIVSEDWE